MENQRNFKKKYDRIRDIEARREYSRNYQKREKEEHLNIDEVNQSQQELWVPCTTCVIAYIHKIVYFKIKF